MSLTDQQRSYQLRAVRIERDAAYDERGRLEVELVDAIQQRDAAVAICAEQATELEQLRTALAAPEPMTEKQLKDLWIKHGATVPNLIRAVERHHGIGPARGE